MRSNGSGVVERNVSLKPFQVIGRVLKRYEARDAQRQEKATGKEEGPAARVAHSRARRSTLKGSA